MLFSQSDSGKANLNSTESTIYDGSSQGINNENENEDTIDKVDEFMYIQMEFCEKSTLRY